MWRYLLSLLFLRVRLTHFSCSILLETITEVTLLPKGGHYMYNTTIQCNPGPPTPFEQYSIWVTKGKLFPIERKSENTVSWTGLGEIHSVKAVTCSLKQIYLKTILFQGVAEEVYQFSREYTDAFKCIPCSSLTINKCV